MKKQNEQVVRHKIKIMDYAEEIGNVSKACRYYGISRDTFYRWRRDYAQQGEKGLNAFSFLLLRMFINEN